MMQDDFRGNAGITVRRIHFEDWQAYREYYLGLKDPHHFACFFKEGQDLDDPETYHTFFTAVDNDHSIMFGAFDGKRMIGQTSLFYSDHTGGRMAVLAGSERADDYRGKRVGDALYEARLQYLRETGFPGRIITTIRPDNTESQKAAARHGFVKTGEMTEHGHEVLELKAA